MLTPQQISQMDRVSGLGPGDISRMDQVSGLGDKPLSNKLSDVFRSLGLGIIPNDAASIYDVGKAAVTRQKIDKNNYSNPFRTQEQFNQQYGGGHKTAYKQSAKDIAGLAGWAVPGAQVTKVPRIAGAAAKGATSLGLIRSSQPDATPGNVAGNAILGALLGPVGSRLIKDTKAANKLVKQLPKSVSTIRHPVETAGKRLQQVVEEAPSSAKELDSLLEKAFGTARNPNENLLERFTARERGTLLRILRNEINTQGRGGSIKVKDIFKFRGGAYDEAFNSNLKTAEKTLNKNMGRAYSDILHKVAPETEPLDNFMHSLLSKKELGKAVGRRLEYVIPSYIAYKLLGKLGL